MLGSAKNAPAAFGGGVKGGSQIVPKIGSKVPYSIWRRVAQQQLGLLGQGHSPYSPGLEPLKERKKGAGAQSHDNRNSRV